MDFSNFFQLYLEADNAIDFLLNPKNKDKTFDEVLDEFKQSGGQLVGRGAFGKVFMHPKWNYVLKTFVNDDCYINFARMASKIKSSAFPKFLSPPKLIVPQYTRNAFEKKIYMVRIEKLNPIDEYQLDAIWRILFDIGFFEKKNKVEQVVDDQQIQQYLDNNNDLPFNNFPDFVWAFNLVLKNKDKTNSSNRGYGCGIDFHEGNIMMRDNKDLVIIDPYAEDFRMNSSFERAEYRREKTNVRYSPDMIKGGKLK